MNLEDVRYLRQSLEFTRATRQSRPTVVGVGGIGSWIAMKLVMMGVEKIYLYDYDIVDEHNRNRSVFRNSDVGKPKVMRFAEFCRELNEDVTILPSNVKVQSINELPKDSDVLFSAVDNAETRVMLEKWAAIDSNRLIIDAGTSRSTTEATVCELKKNETPRYRTYRGAASFDERLEYERNVPACQRRPEPAIITLTGAAADLAVHLFTQFKQDGKVYPILFQFLWGGIPQMNYFEMPAEDWNEV
jgi:molybdopterin/thiamine biosynthesis adenylyltransferase